MRPPCKAVPVDVVPTRVAEDNRFGGPVLWLQLLEADGAVPLQLSLHAPEQLLSTLFGALRGAHHLVVPPPHRVTGKQPYERQEASSIGKDRKEGRALFLMECLGTSPQFRGVHPMQSDSVRPPKRTMIDYVERDDLLRPLYVGAHPRHAFFAGELAIS